MFYMFRIVIGLYFLSSFIPLVASEEIFLRNNLKRAQIGDYIVTSQNKNYTLLHIYDKSSDSLTIEEITVPASKINLNNFSWKNWVGQGAAFHTAWVMYTIDLNSAQMSQFYSISKNGCYNAGQTDSFLSTLLNLRLSKIPLSARKKVGPPPSDGSPDQRRFWQPQIVVEGKAIERVAFDAWRTRWPNDGTEMSGKAIEVYLPQENERYPSYFPYWLQISGMIGKAKVRIVDSGSGMKSEVRSQKSEH